MGLNNIEKKTLGYRILCLTMKFWHNKVYNKNYTIIGKENIPFGKPMIFTPNHQNALMDALALLFSVDIIFVFLARADIFKKPYVAKILYFLKILPIYRERDGSDFKERSNEIFTKTVDIITNGAAMVILPEGNHSRIRRLRPLKKGFARMAFQTEESNNFKLDIHIVPVGIDYDNFFNYRSSLVIKFGKPIPVSEYVEQFKESPAIAINDLKDRLSSRMSTLIPNIKSEEYYDTYNDIRGIYRSRIAKKVGLDVKDLKNRITLDQETIKRVENTEAKSPEKIAYLNSLVQKYTDHRNKLNFSNATIDSKGSCLFSLIMGSLATIGTFPIFLYGLVNNIIPYSLPLWIAGKMKDEQFRSSVKFVISALAFPIFYILQTSVIYGITDNWEITMAYLLSLPITAIISWKWTRIYMWLSQGWRYGYKKVTKDKNLENLTGNYDKIISLLNEITE